MRKWLLIFLTIPCLAQVERDALYEMLDLGAEQMAIQQIQKDCISFPIEVAELERLMKHPQLLLAIIHCLQENKEIPPSSAPLQGDSQTRQSQAGPTAIDPIQEGLRDLAAARQLTEIGARNQAIFNARSRLVDAFLYSTTLPQNLPQMNPPISPWETDVYSHFLKARKEGQAELSFSAAGNVIFRGLGGKKGAQVYMGLYMVDRHRQEKELYDPLEHFVYAHETYPVTYNRQNNALDFVRLESDNIDFLLGRYLKRQPPVRLCPGAWVLEFRVFDGNDRAQGNHKVTFQVEPGQSYQIHLTLESGRNGLQTLVHRLEEQ